MDENRRKELEKRRAELREKDTSPLPDGPIQAALRDRGVPFEPSHVGLWTPAYLAISSSRIDWSRSPSPAQFAACTGLADRSAAARKFLELVAAPGDTLHFYYEWIYDGFDILLSDALEALDILLSSEYEIWITGRPKNWLIEFNRHGEARLATPPALSQAEADAVAARQRGYVGPLVEPLRKAGVPIQVFNRDDPCGPDLPRGQVMYKWYQRKRTVGLPLERGDYEGLASRLRDFIAQKAPGIRDLALDLGFDDSPVLLIPSQAIFAHPKELMSLIECDDASRPRDIQVSSFTLFPSDGSWVVRVIADGPRWKVETTCEKT